MAGKRSLEYIQGIFKQMKELKRFDTILDKVKIISAELGKCTAEFTVEQEHTNAGGTLHGGFSTTLVDIISSFALVTHPKEVPPGLSINIHMKYMKAARLGDEILVEANTIKIERNLAFLDVVIKNKQTGHIIVTGAHTLFIKE